MPSALEASTKANYSRSEWGSLSIQDRIRAMNQQLDAPPPSLVVQTASLPDNPPLNPPSLEAPSKSDTNNLSSSAAPMSPTFRKRSSVVDIWRQREAGGGNVSAANQTDDSNFKDRETAVPSLVPTTRPLAEEEKKVYDDEENTKPKSRSDVWGKQVPSSSRPQVLDFSNETMFDSNTTSSSSNTPNPTARATESSDLIMLQPKSTEPKSNSSKIIAKWAYHSLNDTLEKATMPTAPEKIQEPKPKTENTAAEPKRSKALDLWMKQSEPVASNNPQPEMNVEEKTRNSKRAVSVSSATSDSIDAAIGNAKRTDPNSRSKKGIATNKDEARVEKVGRIAAAANSNKSLAVNNKKTGKSSGETFFAVTKDKESTTYNKGGRSIDVASSDSFFAWSTDEVEATNKMRTDLRVIAKLDPPTGFSPTRKWNKLELSGPSKPRSVDGWNDGAKPKSKPKTRAAPSKRFATPPPLLPNAFSEQHAWKSSPGPSAKFSPFQAQHSPLQTNFGHINTDSPTPKEAKKFWEIKVFHSMSQDKGFQLDWPTLENYNRKKGDVTNPGSKEEERGGRTRPLPSKTQNDSRQLHLKGASVGLQGDLQKPAWQDDGPAWQADAPLWQDDAKVWNGAWPDETPVWSDDGEPWPSEAPVLSDDFRFPQESKAWTDDDMKAKTPYGAEAWSSGAKAMVDAGSGKIVQLVGKSKSLTPVKPVEQRWIAISKKSEVTKRSDESDRIQENSSQDDTSHAFIGNISRAYEESTNPTIYKRPIPVEVSPFKPISPIVANLERRVENQAINADLQGAGDRSMKHIPSVLTLPSLHPLRSVDDKQDRRGHESSSAEVSSRQIGVARKAESHTRDCIPNDAAESCHNNDLLHPETATPKLPSQLPQHESRQSESVHYGVIASSGKIIRRRLFTDRRRWVTSTITSTTKQTSEGLFVKLSSSSASMESTSLLISASNSLSKRSLQPQENTIGSNEAVRNGCQDSPSTMASPSSTRDASPQGELRNLSAANENDQRTIERRSKRAIPSPVRLRSKPQSLPVAPNPRSPEKVSVDSSDQPSQPPTMLSAVRANSPLRVSRALAQPSTIKILPQEKSSACVSAASNLPLLTPTEPSIIQSASSPLRMARLAFVQTSKAHSTGSKLSETTPDSLKARIQIREPKLKNLPDTVQSPKNPSNLTPNKSNATNAVSSQLRQTSNQNVPNRATSSQTATSPLRVASVLSRPAINLSVVVLPTPASVVTAKPGSKVKSPCDQNPMYAGINELHFMPPEASTRNQIQKGLKIDHQPQMVERGDRSAIQSSNAEERRPGVLSATKGKDETVSGQHRQQRGKVSRVAQDGPEKTNSTSLASYKTMVSPWRFGAPSFASTGRNEVKLKTNGTPERSKSAEPRSASTPRRMGVSSITLPSSADRPVRFRRTVLKPDPRRFKAGFRGSDSATKGKEDTLKSAHLQAKRPSDSKMNDSTKPSPPGNSLARNTTTVVDTEKNVARKSGLQERSKFEVQEVDDGDSWSFDELTADSSQVATFVEPSERHSKVPSDQGTKTRKSYQDTCALADSSESSKTESKIHAPSFTSENAVVLPETNAVDSSSQQTQKKSLSIEVLNSSYAKKATAVAPGKVENGARPRPGKIETGVTATTTSKPRESLRVQHKKRLETRYKMPLSPSTKSDAGASDTNLSIFSGASSAFSGWSTTSQSALSSRAEKVLQGRRRQKVSQLLDRPAKGEKDGQSHAPSVAQAGTQETKTRAARSTVTSSVVKDTPPPVEDSRPTLASLYNRTSRFIEEASQVTANVFADSGALSALRGHGLVTGSVLPSPRGTACTPLDVDQASIQAGSRTNSFGSETTESSVEEVQSNASSIPSWTSPDPRLIQTFCAVHTQRIPCKEPCDSVKRRSTVDSCEEAASNVDAFHNAYQSINFTQLAHNLSETVGVKAMDLQKLANEFKDGLSRGIPPTRRRTTRRKLRVPRRRENTNDEEVAIEVEYIEDNSDASYDEDSDEDDDDDDEEVQSSGDVGRQHAAPLKVDTSFPKDMLDGEIEPSMSPAGQPSHESGLHEAR